MNLSENTLFNENSSANIELRYLLERLGITQDLPNINEILTELNELLVTGIDIGFVRQISNSSNSSIPAIWERWHTLIKQITPTQSSSSSDRKQYGLTTRSIPDLKPVKLILLYDSENQKTHISTVKSIKLLFLALIALPDSILHDYSINLYDLASLFTKGVKAADKYKGLTLDFKLHSLQSIIEQIENVIVENNYTSDSNHRIFLQALGKSIAVILGAAVPKTIKKGALTESIKSSLKKSSQPKNRGKKARVKPFLQISTENPDTGELAQLIIEPEEPPLSVLITEQNKSDPINESFSRAIEQTKTKHWLRTFHSNLPWGKRGLNPVTITILTNWLKSDTSNISLILSLMICTSNRFENALELKFGNGGDITPSHFTKKYERPETSKDPDEHILDLLEEHVDSCTLKLPSFLEMKLSSLSSDNEVLQDIETILKIDRNQFKKETSKKISDLISQGAIGLSIDRIHLILPEMISELTGDQFLSYLITGREGEMTPVSAYYSSYTIDFIAKIYEKAVTQIFS